MDYLSRLLWVVDSMMIWTIRHRSLIYVATRSQTLSNIRVEGNLYIADVSLSMHQNNYHQHQPTHSKHPDPTDRPSSSDGHSNLNQLQAAEILDIIPSLPDRRYQLIIIALLAPSSYIVPYYELRAARLVW